MLYSITRRASDVRRFAFLFLLLSCIGAMWPSMAHAQTSFYCPVLAESVVRGGSVDVDVSLCDGPFDAGMSEPIAGFGAAHGTVTIGANVSGVQSVTYAHDNSASPA